MSTYFHNNDEIENILRCIVDDLNSLATLIFIISDIIKIDVSCILLRQFLFKIWQIDANKTDE